MFGGMLGWILGSLGGGGSILMIPVLNYVFHVEFKQAIPQAVFIVGITSFFATILHWRHGAVNYRMTAIFVGSGLLGILLGNNTRQTIDEGELKIVLAGFLLLLAFLMLRSSKKNHSPDLVVETNGKNGIPSERMVLVLVVGWTVGFLTSFLGVTGGFIIVPTLTLLARLPIHQAIGTSLAVITMNCSLTLSGEIHREWDWQFLLPFIIGSLVVSIFAAKMAKNFSEAKQKKRFAMLSLVVAVLMLSQIFVDTISS